jgi:hypothetical protein
MKKSILLLFLIILVYVVSCCTTYQQEECYKRIDINTTHIDLGGYVLYSCADPYVIKMPSSIKDRTLYAEKNGVRKKLSKISDFSGIIKNIDNEYAVNEFLSVLAYFSEFNYMTIEEWYFNSIMRNELTKELRDRQLCPTEYCTDIGSSFIVLGNVESFSVNDPYRIIFHMTITPEKIMPVDQSNAVPSNISIRRLRYYDRENENIIKEGNFITYLSLYELGYWEATIEYIKFLNQTEYEDMMKIEFPKFEETKINETDEAFIIERTLGIYASAAENHDKIIISLESLSKNGEYVFTIQRTIFEAEYFLERAH